MNGDSPRAETAAEAGHLLECSLGSRLPLERDVPAKFDWEDVARRLTASRATFGLMVVLCWIRSLMPLLLVWCERSCVWSCLEAT